MYLNFLQIKINGWVDYFSQKYYSYCVNFGSRNYLGGNKLVKRFYATYKNSHYKKFHKNRYIESNSDVKSSNVDVNKTLVDHPGILAVNNSKSEVVMVNVTHSSRINGEFLKFLGNGSYLGKSIIFDISSMQKKIDFCKFLNENFEDSKAISASVEKRGIDILNCKLNKDFFSENENIHDVVSKLLK